MTAHDVGLTILGLLPIILVVVSVLISNDDDGEPPAPPNSSTDSLDNSTIGGIV